MPRSAQGLRLSVHQRAPDVRRVLHPPPGRLAAEGGAGHVPQLPLRDLQEPVLPQPGRGEGGERAARRVRLLRAPVPPLPARQAPEGGVPGQGDPMQIQEDWLPLAGPFPRAVRARGRVQPPHQDGQRADGDPGRDGPEPQERDAALQQHLQPAQLREDWLHRGPIPPVPHRRLHHAPVLRDAAAHRAQPDLGAEGARQRLGAQPQPLLQAHPELPADPQEQSQLAHGMLLPPAGRALRRRQDQPRHLPLRLQQREQRDRLHGAAHRRLGGVQQTAGGQEHQPAAFYIPDPKINDKNNTDFGGGFFSRFCLGGGGKCGNFSSGGGRAARAGLEVNKKLEKKKNRWESVESGLKNHKKVGLKRRRNGLGAVKISLERSKTAQKW